MNDDGDSLGLGIGVRIDIVKGCVKAAFIHATSFNVYLDC